MKGTMLRLGVMFLTFLPVKFSIVSIFSLDTFFI